MSQKLSKIIDVNSNNEKDIKNYGLGKEVNVEINSLSVIPIIADKIYKDPMSSIRELYDNEKTACNKAQQLKPELKDIQKIVIELNTDTRELTIQGVNSLGIDSYTFMNILRIMGNSGNNQGDQKGLFGIGFFSFFKISERIIIISKSLESQEDFAYICKSALKFEQLNPENYQSLDTSGFKISLTIKDSVDLEEIQQYIKKIVKVSNIKTEFIQDGESVYFDQYDSIKDLFESDYSEYFEDPLSCKYSLYWEEYNTEDFELIIGKLEDKKGESKKIHHQTFLVNTPIELNVNFPYGVFYYINVKNERKFKPTPDRERFEKESEVQLNEDLGKYDLENFDKEKLTKPQTIFEWYDNYNKYFFEEIGEISLYFKVKSTKYTDYNDRHTFQPLYYHLPVRKPTKLNYSLSFRKKKFNELPEDNFVITPKSKSVENLKRLEDLGFNDIVTKRSSRSYTRSTTTRSNANLFNNNFKIHTNANYTCEKDQADNFDFIIRAEDLAEDKRVLSRILGGYRHEFLIGLVSPMANIKADSWSILYETLKDKVFMSSHGLIDFKTLLKIIKINHHNTKNRKRYHNYVTYMSNMEFLRLKTLREYTKNQLIVIIDDEKIRMLIEIYLDKTYRINFNPTNIQDSYENDIKNLIGEDELLLKLFETKFQSYSNYNTKEEYELLKEIKERFK